MVLLRVIGFAVALLALLVISPDAGAVMITHIPDDRVPPVAVTPANGTLVAGGAAGTNYIDFGVDYSFGGVEGVFDDGPAGLKFCGINASNVCDLVSSVDASIVLLGTTTPGLTDFVSVVAGIQNIDGALSLQVYDTAGTLIAAASASGTDTDVTISVDFAGSFQAAWFRVSTSDSSDLFGVRSVTIGRPVPEPGTLLLLGSGILGLGLYGRRKNT